MARKESLFIDESIFKQLSPIAGTLDMDYIRPHMITAQDMRIQPVLGTKLYNELQEKIYNEELTDDDELLLDDYIRKAMIWWTNYESMIFLAVKISNTSIVQKSTVGETSITLDDAKRLQREADGKAEFYTQRLINFLVANRTIYTNYDVVEDGEMASDTSNYDGAFVFDDDDDLDFSTSTITTTSEPEPVMEIGWEDLVGSLIARRLESNSGKLNYNYDENAITMQSGGRITNRNDRLIFNFQKPHGMTNTGETMNLHIHWEQDTTNDIEFTIQYRIQSNGVLKNTVWETVVRNSNDNNTYVYPGSGTFNQITRLVELDLVEVGLSASIEFRLARTDSTSGDINAVFIDAHVPYDQGRGSEGEYTKYE